MAFGRFAHPVFFLIVLIVRELENASLQKCVSLAIQAFEDETGIEVPHRLDGAPHHGDKPLQAVAYRTVYESLHNAYKHAGARGLEVSTDVTGEGMTIRVLNRAPTTAGLGASGDQMEAELGAHTGISLGIIGMTKRARSVGGQLSVGRERQIFSVTLVLPLVSASSHASLAEVPALRPAAQQAHLQSARKAPSRTP